MLGRAAVVVAASLLLVSPSFAQCNYTPVRSAQFRTSALDIAIEGNDLWLATSYGVSLYDRTVDPPELVASVAVPGITRVIRVRNGIAYAGSGSSVVVVQRSGAHTLRIAQTIDAGATVNDIAVTTSHLYAATVNGLAQLDLLNPLNLIRTSATFPTSRATVTSLALINNTLYAADADASIEAFNIAIPTAPSASGSVAAPAAVTLVRASNGQLYASSGALSTYVFIGTGGAMAHFGTAAFGTASLTPFTADIVFVAGTDRRLRAVDFTLADSPIEIFRDDVPPTAGTVNRIAAMATAGNRLYVAGGDMGLLTYDLTGFTAPFPVRGYASGGAGSIVSFDNRIYAGRDIGGILEFTRSTSGMLTSTRSWDTTRISTVWDGSNGLLLSSSGSTMTMWSVQSLSSTPVVVASATFRAPPVSAVLVGTTGYAVLSDRTLWSADFAQAAPVPRQITIANIAPSALSRSGGGIVVADVRDDGNTQLAFFATADVNQTPRTASVAGAAVTGVTLSGNTAAVLTFRGITIVDFIAGTQTVLSNSSGLARHIQLSGSIVYQLTDSQLVVWDIQRNAVVKRFTIPGDAIAINVAPSSTTADIATSSGVVTVATNSATPLPAAFSSPNGNAYYRRVAAGADRIHLFDGSKVDIYTTALRYIGSLRGSITDVAANDRGVYTVTNGLVVTSHTPDGIPRGSFTISEGADARPVAIRAVGDAVWVSIERGCSTFLCEKKTIVFDPRTGMTQTFNFAGVVLDVFTAGTRAYALTDLPSEIRVMNISDPFHPVTIVSTASGAAPVSIAYANTTVYVLGDKLTAYAESTLTSIGEILGSYVPDPTGVIASVDQRVRIEGNCAVVTGRSFAPQLFTIAAPGVWTPAASFAMPAPTRSVAAQPGTIHFLTDHSLETWSTTALPKPPRRPPAR